MVEAAVGVPPCCAGCVEYDRDDGVCRLLADPILEHRRRLLTMPCDVSRLLELRLRAHGPDLAQEAVVAWLSPAWDPDDLSLSYGRAPRDARLWLGSWPYLYLARDAVRRVHRGGERLGGGDDHVEPEMLVAHAANALPPDQALFVTGHLAACADGSCPGLVAEMTVGIAAAREALYDHRREQHAAPDGEGAHTFECRDGLWEIFEAMARDEGSTPDRLIADAMRAYAEARAPTATAP